MKKLSNIFLKVGIILGIIDIVVLALAAVACFVISAFVPQIFDAVANYGAGQVPTGEELEVAIIITTASLIASGILCLFFVPAYIVIVVLAKKTRNEPKKGLYIADIVLGGLFGSYFTLAGGIIGLVNFVKEQRRAQIVE